MNLFLFNQKIKALYGRCYSMVSYCVDKGNAHIQWPPMVDKGGGRYWELKQKVKLADQLTEQIETCEVKARS